jgi:hypothetical protein
MPEIVSCPEAECGKKLRVPDNLLGKKVKCPGCSRMFVAQAGTAGAETSEKAQGKPAEEELLEEEVPTTRKSRKAATDDEVEERSRAVSTAPSRRSSSRSDEEEEETRPRSRRFSEDDEDEEERTQRSRRRRSEEDEGPRRWGKRSQLEKIRTAINLVLLAGHAMLATYACAAITTGILLLTGGSMLGAMMGGFRGTPGFNPWNQATGSVLVGMVFLMLFGILAGGLWLADVILRLVGLAQCMSHTPAQRSSARTLALFAFICVILEACVGLGGYYVVNGVYVGGLNGIAATAGLILWLFYLYQVCQRLQIREGMAGVKRSAIGFGIYIGVVCVILEPLQFFLVGGGILGFAGSMQTRSVGGAFLSMGSAYTLILVVQGLKAAAWMGVFVWYLLILKGIRDAVGRAARRA